MSFMYPSPEELRKLPSIRNLSMFTEMLCSNDVINMDDFSGLSDTRGLELEMDCLTKPSVHDDERVHQAQSDVTQDVDERVFFDEKEDDSERMQIELSPGLTTHYRFATETMDAFQRGQTVVHQCIACGTRCHIVDDAEFVICPVDNVIQPIEAVVVVKKNIGRSPAPRRGIYRQTAVQKFHPRLMVKDSSERDNNGMDASSFRDKFVKSFSISRIQKRKIGGIGLGILDL